MMKAGHTKRINTLQQIIFNVIHTILIVIYMTIGQNWEWNSMKNSNMAYATPHANGLSLPIRFETQEYPSKN